MVAPFAAVLQACMGSDACEYRRCIRYILKSVCLRNSLVLSGSGRDVRLNRLVSFGITWNRISRSAGTDGRACPSIARHACMGEEETPAASLYRQDVCLPCLYIRRCLRCYVDHPNTRLNNSNPAIYRESSSPIAKRNSDSVPSLPLFIAFF